MGLAMQTRPLEPLDFREGGESVVKIYKDNLLAGFALRVSGLMDITTAVTFHEDAPHRLLDRAEVQIKSNTVIHSLDGRRMYEVATMDYQAAPNFVLPATGIAANLPFSFFLPVDFRFSEDDLRGILDPAGWSSFDLKIKWNRASDLITAGAMTIKSVTVTTEALEVVRSMENLNNKLLPSLLATYAKKGQITKPITQAGETRIELPLGNEYKAIMLVAVQNGVRSDALLNNIKLDLSGGQVVYAKDAALLKDRNRLAYEVGPETGVYWMDFDPSRSGNGWIPTAGRSSATLILDVAAPVGDCKIHVIPIQAVRAA